MWKVSNFRKVFLFFFTLSFRTFLLLSGSVEISLSSQHIGRSKKSEADEVHSISDKKVSFSFPPSILLWGTWSFLRKTSFLIFIQNWLENELGILAVTELFIAIITWPNLKGLNRPLCSVFRPLYLQSFFESCKLDKKGWGSNFWTFYCCPNLMN